MKNSLSSKGAGNSLNIFDVDKATLVFAAMLTVYIIHEVYEFRKIKGQKTLLTGYLVYIRSWKNILDTLLIGSSILYLTTLAYNNFILNEINSQLTQIDSNFYSLHYLLFVDESLQLECYFMIVIAFLKALNLLKLNPKAYLITDTIVAGFGDLALFIMFVCANYVFFGFIGYMLFNVDAQFGTLSSSVYNSILSIVRPIDFQVLAEKKFFWLFSWQVIVYFYAQRILINFVIAVIIYYFDCVTSNHTKSNMEQTLNRILKSVLEFFKFSPNLTITT